jgi:pheromone receptor transcription factor
VRGAADVQACLNAPEPLGGGEGVEDSIDESTEEQAQQHQHQQQQHMPPQQGRPGMSSNPQMHPGYGVPMDQQAQAMAYQNYMAHQQRGQTGYAMPAAAMAQHHPHQA